MSGAFGGSGGFRAPAAPRSRWATSATSATCWAGSSASRRRAPKRGADVETALHLSFEDAVRGVTTSVSLPTDAAVPHVQGHRCRAGDHARRVRAVPRARRARRRQGHVLSVDDLPGVPGARRADRDAVPHVPRLGPRGVQPLGEGAHPARRRGRPADPCAGARASPDSRARPAGDLYVVVHVSRDPRFGRKGRNLTTRRADLLRRRRARRRRSPSTRSTGRSRSGCAPGTSPGTTLRVRGRGVAGARQGALGRPARDHRRDRADRPHRRRSARRSRRWRRRLGGATEGAMTTQSDATRCAAARRGRRRGLRHLGRGARSWACTPRRCATTSARASSTPRGPRAAPVASPTRDIALLRRIQQLTSEGHNLEGVRRILELERELDALRGELEALQASARAPRRRDAPHLPARPRPPAPGGGRSGAHRRREHAMTLDPNRWTTRTKEAFNAALQQATAAGHAEVTPEHLLARDPRPARGDRRTAPRPGRRRRGRCGPGAARGARRAAAHRRRLVAASSPATRATASSAPTRSVRTSSDDFLSVDHVLLAFAPLLGTTTEALLEALRNVRGSRADHERRTPRTRTSRSRSTAATSPRSRARASSTRSSAATRRSAASSRCSRAGPRTTRC